MTFNMKGSKFYGKGGQSPAKAKYDLSEAVVTKDGKDVTGKKSKKRPERVYDTEHGNIVYPMSMASERFIDEQTGNISTDKTKVIDKKGNWASVKGNENLINIGKRKDAADVDSKKLLRVRSADEK